jgi:glycosidase
VDDPASLLNHYRRLIQLHAAHPALGSGDFIPITSSARGLTAYLRVAGDDLILVVLNFGDERENAPMFSLDPNSIAPGTYSLESLLGGMPAPPLTIEADGTVSLWGENASIPANATLVYAVVRVG